MKQRRYRWLFRLAVLLVVGLGFLVWSNRQRSQGLLTIQNRSGQSITLLEVTLAGETPRKFENVQDGSDRTVSPIQKDVSLVVSGRLADDTRIKASFGRVPEGKGGEPAVLIIIPGGQIMVRQGKNSSP